MSTLKFQYYPSQILRNENQEISENSADLQKLIKAMITTMYKKEGVGLAAPQVGHNIRLTVIDVSEKQNSPIVLINPEITQTRNKIKSEEGCLSIPGYREIITRHEWVKVKALNKDFQPFEIEGEGLLSRCLQHEIDHLNGILFIDHLGRLKKRMFEKWFLTRFEDGNDE